MTRGWLKRLLLGPEDGDGAGQGFWEDMRWAVRFRRVRRTPIAWRRPTDEEARFWDAHPLFGRFGDGSLAVAEHDGMRWVVRDRLWFGWPDPPEFVVFALNGNDIWLGRDFDHWPRAWGPKPSYSV